LNHLKQSFARYDKIHLFDVNIALGHAYQESDSTHPGSHIVVIDSSLGKLGLSVCYDLRFPELYREMCLQGADPLEKVLSWLKST
jgi:nitrilase